VFVVTFVPTTGVGHQSLTIIIRYALILVSALDPDSIVRIHSHLSVFQIQTKAKLFAFFVYKTKKYPFGYFLLVPTTGVEPARPYGHIPLKDARLPIPPRGHSFCDSWCTVCPISVCNSS
jgi:hypothetical protein